jgi:8-oxo-dGTP pyrophosphatase MutT (NUDIX family)
MQIIRELEPEPRNFYCGSIGFIGDDGRLMLNVAIRTATIAADTIEYPVGAGIVADSDPESEWNETMAKAWPIIRVSESTHVRRFTRYRGRPQRKRLHDQRIQRQQRPSASARTWSMSTSSGGVPPRRGSIPPARPSEARTWLMCCTSDGRPNEGHSGSLSGTWQPLMGHIEPGETSVDCAWRELKEEVGLDQNSEELLGLWSLEQVHPYFLASKNAIMLSPRFAVEVAGEWHAILNDEHDAVRWIRASDAEKSFMWPGQRAAIREIRHEIIKPGRCRSRGCACGRGPTES